MEMVRLDKKNWKRKVSDGIVGELFLCVGEFGLSCKKSLAWDMEISVVVLSRGHGLLQCAGSGGGRRKMEVGERDDSSVAGELGTCSMEYRGNVPCFWNVVAVVGDDRIAVAYDAVSVTDGEVEEAGVKDGMQEFANGALSELHSGVARDFLGDLGVKSSSR